MYCTVLHYHNASPISQNYGLTLLIKSIIVVVSATRRRRGRSVMVPNHRVPNHRVPGMYV